MVTVEGCKVHTRDFHCLSFRPFLCTPHKWWQLRVAKFLPFIYWSCQCPFHIHLSQSSLSLSLSLSERFTSIMDWPLRLFFTAFLIAAAAIDGTQADATVAGTVFCDQCKDGQISIFDYPLYGRILHLIFFLWVCLEFNPNYVSNFTFWSLIFFLGSF